MSFISRFPRFFKWTKNSKSNIYWGILENNKWVWNNEFQEEKSGGDGVEDKCELNNKKFYLAVKASKLNSNGNYNVTITQQQYTYKESRIAVCVGQEVQQTGFYVFDDGNNKYTATYTFTFGDFSREMTTETYKVPNAWIVDAVGCAPRDEFQWLVIDPSLDAGWTWCAENNSDKNRRL